MEGTKDAKRYLDNARQILSEKAGKVDDIYQDKKHVKMAGNTAYNGVLVALDTLLGAKKKGRKDIRWYQEQLASMDKKVLQYFVLAYDGLHLAMGYDGNQDVVIAQRALSNADRIIEWVGTRLGEA